MNLAGKPAAEHAYKHAFERGPHQNAADHGTRLRVKPRSRAIQKSQHNSENQTHHNFVHEIPSYSEFQIGGNSFRTFGRKKARISQMCRRTATRAARRCARGTFGTGGRRVPTTPPPRSLSHNWRSPPVT